MANINKIKLSGTTYNIQDLSAAKSVELTQAQYDALVSGGTVDPNTFYIITDAQGADLSQYYTSAQTESAITAAVSGKVDTSSVVTAVTSASTDNEIPTAKAVWEAASGGGKAIEAGRGISITTGATADTVSFNLPISADTDGSVNKLLVGSGNTIGSDTNKNIVIGDNNTTVGGSSSIRIYSGATIIGYNNYVGCNGLQNDNNDWSTAIGRRNKIGGGNTYIIGVDNNFYDADFYGRKKNYSYVIGRGNTSSLSADGNNIFVFGAYNKITKSDEFALGEYNASSNDGTTSGNTFFSIGNGTSNNARHNAFEIRQNGDIYLTKDGQDVKLQDQLGGSSITVDTALDSGSTNPVENRVIYNKIDEVEQVTAAALNNINDRLSEDEEVTAAGLNAVNDKFDGLKLKKLTQAEYDALSGSTDANTLYVIVN